MRSRRLNEERDELVARRTTGIIEKGGRGPEHIPPARDTHTLTKKARSQKAPMHENHGGAPAMAFFSLAMVQWQKIADRTIRRES